MDSIKSMKTLFQLPYGFGFVHKPNVILFLSFTLAKGGMRYYFCKKALFKLLNKDTLRYEKKKSLYENHF